jgi:hypothetical protein
MFGPPLFPSKPGLFTESPRASSLVSRKGVPPSAKLSALVIVRGWPRSLFDLREPFKTGVNSPEFRVCVFTDLMSSANILEI